MDHLRHNLTYQFELSSTFVQKNVLTILSHREPIEKCMHCHHLVDKYHQNVCPKRLPNKCICNGLFRRYSLAGSVMLPIFPIEPTKTQTPNQINLLNNNNSVLRRCRFRFLKFAIRRIQIKHKSQFVRTVHNANRFQVDHINFVENLFKRLVHIRQQNV